MASSHPSDQPEPTYSREDTQEYSKTLYSETVVRSESGLSPNKYQDMRWPRGRSSEERLDHGRLDRSKERRPRSQSEQRLLHDLAKHKARVEATSGSQRQQTSMVGELQGKLGAYERTLTEVETELRAGMRVRPARGVDVVDSAISHSEADVSVLVSEQLEASMEANRELSRDLERTQRKYAKLREELERKQHVWSQQDQSLSAYFTAEHSRLLELWGGMQGLRRDLGDVRTSTGKDLDAMRTELHAVATQLSSASARALLTSFAEKAGDSGMSASEIRQVLSRIQSTNGIGMDSSVLREIEEKIATRSRTTRNAGGRDASSRIRNAEIILNQLLSENSEWASSFAEGDGTGRSLEDALSHLKGAWGHHISETKRLQQRLGEAERETSGLRSRLHSADAAVATQTAELDDRCNALGRQLEGLKIERDGLVKQKNVLSQQLDAIRNEQVEELRAAREEAREVEGRLRTEFGRAQTEAKELRERLHKHQAQEEELRARVGEREVEAREAEGRAGKAAADAAQLKARLATLDAESDDLRTRLAQSQSQRITVESQKQESIQTLEFRVQKYEQKLETKERLIKELETTRQEEVEKWRGKAQTAEANVSELGRRLRDVETTAAQERKAVLERAEDATTAVQRFESQLQVVLNEKKRLEDERNRLQSQITAISSQGRRQAEEAAEVKATHQKTVKELEELRVRVSETKASESSVREERESWRRERERVEEERRETTARFTQTLHRITALEDQIRTLESNLHTSQREREVTGVRLRDVESVLSAKMDELEAANKRLADLETRLRDEARKAEQTRAEEVGTLERGWGVERAGLEEEVRRGAALLKEREESASRNRAQAHKDLALLQDQIRSFEDERKTLEHQLKISTDTVTRLESSNKSLREEITTTSQSKESILVQLAEAREQVDSLMVAKSRLESQVQSHRLEVTDWKRRVEEMGESVEREERRARVAEAERDDLSSRIGTVTQTIATLEASESSVRRELDALRRSEAEEAADRDRLKAELHRLRSEASEWAVLRQNWDRERAALQMLVDEAESERTRLEESFSEAGVQSEALHRSLNTMEAENGELHTELEKLQSRLSGLESQHGGRLVDLSAKLRSRYEEELESVEAAKTAAERAAAKVRGTLSGLQEQNRVLREELRREQRLRKEVAEAASEQSLEIQGLQRRLNETSASAQLSLLHSPAHLHSSSLRTPTKPLASSSPYTTPKKPS